MNGDVAFPGYRFLLGPEQLRMPGDGRPVKTRELYREWHTVMITSAGAKPWDAGRQAVARVNHGRWLADCLWCAGGMLTRPSWGVAYCAECGARYEVGAVVFPEHHAAIEATLVRRVRRSQQNWDCRQSLDELFKETAEVLIP